MSDADRFAAQDTAHDTCQYNCYRIVHGIDCPAPIEVMLSTLEARALRAAVQWTQQLAAAGKIELHDWQREAFATLEQIGLREGKS